jgi:hypothetical protein
MARKKRGESADDERPWTEQEWERFIEKADARSARYQELFETLLDHPQRDKLIRKEMGWKFDPELEAELERMEQEHAAEAEEWDEADDEAEPPEADGGSEASDEEAEDEEPFAEYEREMMAIPAYARAMLAAERIGEGLQEVAKRLETAGQEDEDLSDAAAQMMVATAKIANGHGMGYEDEVLCGNIVQCKRALAAALTCERALGSLMKRGLLSSGGGKKLLAEAEAARLAIEARIVELRKRVWW